jgi:hypothetical protein
MRRVAVIAAGLLVLPALLSPGPAAATYDEVGSGETRLALDGQFLALMQRNGVKLSVRAPATLKNGVVTFPAVRGKLDPTNGRATVEHDGTLLLKADRGVVSLKALQVKTGRRAAPLAAKLGGGQLKLGAAGGARFSRSGFGIKFRSGPLRLAPKVAARLNKRLHLQVIVGSTTKLGTATSSVQPAAVSIRGEGRASLELDPGFVGKLDQLHVAVNPIFPAERQGPFTFEIFGGRLAPDLSVGRLELRGGLELLQLGGGKVTWVDPHLDLDIAGFEAETEIQPSPPYAGKVGLMDVASFGRPPAAADPGRRTISLAAAGMGLSAASAATLNEVFAKPQGQDQVFAAGETVGRIGFTAQAQ